MMAIKKFLFVLCCLPILTWAQEYKPMLDTYNEWQLTYCFFGCGTDIYYTDGDTLVDGKSYKILDGYHYISRYFLLREDVPQQKVYLNFVLNSPGEEWLLYDFSMEEGDSIDMKNPISPFIQDAGYYQVDSIIPRPLEDGALYDHYYLSPTPSNTISSNNAVWIEGIGSLSIVNAPGGDPDINGVGQLSCFFKNGELFYSNLDSIDACKPTVILDLKESKEPLAGLTLISNPEAQLHELLNAENVAEVKVYSIHGKLLKTLAHHGENLINISLEGQPSGIYIVKASSTTFSNKVFKIVQ